MTREVELFFDIGSSYSYLAATQMAGLTERTGVPVRWRPFLLGGVFKATGNETPAKLPAKARYLINDLMMWAAEYGVPARMPSRFPLNTLRVGRFLVGLPNIPPAALSLFHAYWAEDRDPTTDESLVSAAQAAGVDPATAIAAIDTQDVKDRLRANTDEAVARGAFGAPSMFVGDTMFWGNDRIPMLEKFLTR